MVVRRLSEEYPGSAKQLCALNHDTPFQLLAATILSAQSTDARVNMVTPVLFDAFPTAEALAAAPVEKVEEIIHSTGFFRAKARSLSGMAQGVAERFGGEVPSAMDDLTSLPGVGRKTANVVRSVDFDEPGLPVDTHVLRVTRRLGLTERTDPDDVEQELNALVAPDERGTFSLRVILHGRAVCKARAPLCSECVLADICPSAQLPVRPSSGSGRARATGSRATAGPPRAVAPRPRRAR
jgi:endonuclease III